MEFMKWTNTVAVVIEVEETDAKGQWRIGDAIVKDLAEKSPADFPPTFKECAEKLQARGYDYSTAYLRKLYKAALAFGHNERDPKYSWDAHCEAGNPANLREAAAALNKIHKAVTQYNIRDLMKHWRDKATNNRQGRKAVAETAKMTATAAKVKATEDKLSAKDKAARDEAEERRQAAIIAGAEAQKEIKKNSGAPPFNSDLKVVPRPVTALERYAVSMVLNARIAKMRKLAKRTLEDAAGIDAKLLSTSERQTIADRCDAIIAVLKEINAVVGC